MPAVSRFQAVALGSRIFIHHHRSSSSILVLDTEGQAPQLSEVPLSSEDAPSPRCVRLTGVLCWSFGDCMVMCLHT